MSTTNENSESTESTKSIVDAVFDLGMTWAEYGLAQGTSALEHSARALSKTARSLDAIRTALKDEPKAA